MKMRDDEKTLRRSREVFELSRIFTNCPPTIEEGKIVVIVRDQGIILIILGSCVILSISTPRLNFKPNLNHFVPPTQQDRSLRLTFVHFMFSFFSSSSPSFVFLSMFVEEIDLTKEFLFSKGNKKISGRTSR